MDCKEITKITVVQRAISNPDERPLLEKIYNCIYTCFKQDFIDWIAAIYSGKGINKSALEEMARDAFQEGVLNFYRKTDSEGLKE